MVKISTPTEDNLDEVLEFAFRHLPVPERNIRILSILEQHKNGRVPLEGIFVAENDAGIVDVLFSQPRKDCGVMLWVPSLLESCPADVLFEPFVEYCRKNDFQAALALADNRQTFNVTKFVKNGQFEYLSDLVHFAVQVHPVLPAYFSETCYFQPLCGKIDEEKRLERVVQETYNGTLDFPRLMGAFPVDKVIEGYRLDGLYLRKLWFFVQDENRNDIGVLLLADCSEYLEIMYMGLTAEVRGHGLAKEVIRFALSVAKELGYKLLTAAADERNKPAMRAYIGQGFQAWDRKKIFVRFFR
ncbi:MAG: GNAT family N-acetyltransferase [Planctomycetaceae bacterium]|nr:GNAT family N-acetyltransferase [Planctomycetaceae bacterium]